MDNDVSAGATTTIVGRLALGITLLAFGLGHTDVIDGVTAADAVSIAQYVGGIALFVAGLMAFRDRDTANGTAFAALGALWFTWAVSDAGSANAAGLFLTLFALVALVLMAIARFADNDGLTKVGGWFAVAAGAVAWYAATAAMAHWPTVLPRRAAGRGVTATG